MTVVALEHSRRPSETKLPSFASVVLLVVASLIPPVVHGMVPCMSAIDISDFNHDGKLDRDDEYVSFLNLISDNLFDQAQFADLPKALQQNYVQYTKHVETHDSIEAPRRWEEVVVQEFCGNSTAIVSQSPPLSYKRHVASHENQMDSKRFKEYNSDSPPGQVT